MSKFEVSKAYAIWGGHLKKKKQHKFKAEIRYECKYLQWEKNYNKSCALKAAQHHKHHRI